jgi:hypothetical protein
MFKTRRTKIISVPAEEILEVVAQEPIEEPQSQTVSNIQQLSVMRQDDQTASGTLIDGENKEYEYVWDKRLKRIDSLSGERVDRLTWELCNTVLTKYWVRTESKQAEIPVELKIAEALKVALAPVVSSIKSLENKINSRPAPAPQQSAPRPQTVQSVPSSDIPAVSVADDDISSNAMRYLQQTSTPDLGIDYMSL